MKETVQNATSASVTVSATTGTVVATGVLDTVNTYAPIIGLVLTTISLTLAIVFFCINHKRETKRIYHENQTIIDEIRDDVIQQIKNGVIDIE